MNILYVPLWQWLFFLAKGQKAKSHRNRLHAKQKPLFKWFQTRAVSRYAMLLIINHRVGTITIIYTLVETKSSPCHANARKMICVAIISENRRY